MSHITIKILECLYQLEPAGYSLPDIYTYTERQGITDGCDTIKKYLNALVLIGYVQKREKNGKNIYFVDSKPGK